LKRGEHRVGKVNYGLQWCHRHTVVGSVPGEFHSFMTTFFIKGFLCGVEVNLSSFWINQ